jgi:hypothetical protein
MVWEVRMIIVLSLVDCEGSVPLNKKDLLGCEEKMTAVSNKNHYVPGHNGIKVVTSIWGYNPINIYRTWALISWLHVTYVEFLAEEAMNALHLQGFV